MLNKRSHLDFPIATSQTKVALKFETAVTNENVKPAVSNACNSAFFPPLGKHSTNLDHIAKLFLLTFNCLSLEKKYLGPLTNLNESKQVNHT